MCRTLPFCFMRFPFSLSLFMLALVFGIASTAFTKLNNFPRSRAPSAHLSSFLLFTVSFTDFCFLFLFQAKLLESSHGWLGASTSTLAGKYQPQGVPLTSRSCIKLEVLFHLRIMSTRSPSSLLPPAQRFQSHGTRGRIPLSSVFSFLW